MDLQSMSTEELQRAILRTTQALGGGTSAPSAPARKLSPQEKSDAEWRLRRIAQEMNVLERPRAYETPEQPPAFQGEALRPDETMARPMGTHGVMTPEFTRETGIYMTPEGTITNRGSRPAAEVDPGVAEDKAQLEQEKRRLEQALAGHEQAVRLETQGVKEKDTALDVARTKATGDVVSKLIEQAGKVPVGEKENIESLIKRRDNLDAILDINKIQDASGMMVDLTPEHAQQLQKKRDEINQLIEAAKASGKAGPAPAPAPGGATMQVGESIYFIDKMKADANARPEMWNRAKTSGKLPPEIIQAVEGTPAATPASAPAPAIPAPAPAKAAPTQKAQPPAEDEVQAMLGEIQAAKEAKDRPRLHQLRKQNRQAYDAAMKVYRKEGKVSVSGETDIPGSTLKVGQAGGMDAVWENLSEDERSKAVNYEKMGWKVYPKNGKLYVNYMGSDFLIGPKGE